MYTPCDSPCPPFRGVSEVSAQLQSQTEPRAELSKAGQPLFASTLGGFSCWSWQLPLCFQSRKEVFYCQTGACSPAVPTRSYSQLKVSEFLKYLSPMLRRGFPSDSDGKESTCNTGDRGSIPRSGRSPGGGNGNPLHYSCLGNLMDRGAWWTTVHGVTKSQTRLSN